MGDMADDFRAMREHRKRLRREEGDECEGCIRHHPKRNPSVLFKGQTCRWCGWRRPTDVELAKYHGDCDGDGGLA